MTRGLPEWRECLQDAIQMNKKTVEGQTASPQLQRIGAGAADELRAVVRAALGGLFTGFMDHMRAALTQAAQAVPNRAAQASSQQLTQQLASTAEGWSNGFLKHVDDQLVGGLAGSRQESTRAQGGAEEVAVAGMELRAEARYQAQIAELDVRLNRIRLMLYVPIYARALAPAGLFRSLHDTAEAQGWPVAQRLFLFKQFDAKVIPQLETLYRMLLDALKTIGAAAEKVAADNPPAAEAAAPVIHAKPVADRDALTGKVDTATLAMLKACSLNTSGEGYSDGSLAADLLALADKRPLPGMTQQQCDVPLQRMELAGRFLNEVIADPLVPAELRPQHEAMRLPLIKSALADPTLFTEASHPLRSLVNEFMQKSALSRITNTPESRRMADLLKEVLENFNLAPDFVRQAMVKAEPIQKGQIQRFFEQQRQQAEQSRLAVISEAKRLVARELQRASFGPDVPAPAIKFLDNAWGPVATRQLLQYGAADEHWKGTLQLMEQIMAALETRQPDEPPTPEWKELMRGVTHTMQAEGMSKAAIKEALSGLEAARNTVA